MDFDGCRDERKRRTATREITDAYPEAKVLIVTKHETERLREAARASGACGYVLKENLLEIRGIIGLT